MLKQFSNYCSALMLLTSIHHVYGAAIYHTPWRLHVLALSIPVIIFNLYMVRRIQKRQAAFYIFLFVNVVVTMILIGIYEGGYNHLAKNLLFFGGASRETMLSLFPPPVYVMPDDLIFELTGVLQAFLLIPVIFYFLKLTRSKIAGMKH